MGASRDVFILNTVSRIARQHPEYASTIPNLSPLGNRDVLNHTIRECRLTLSEAKWLVRLLPDSIRTGRPIAAH